MKLNGRLGPGGVALHLHARGDADHWVLPAKGFDFVVADELQWAAELEVSYAVQTESLELTLQAADERGRLGPTQETSLGLLPDVPAAQLLVSLAWDAAVDLDLHVELPNGTIVGAKNINSIEPSAGAVATAEEALQGGFLDYDSNQHCEFDLRNRENVVWLNDTAPSGKYKVYAHLFSPCASHAVNFTAAVEYEGEILNQASSTLVAFDSRVHPTEGAAPGLLLLEFKIP